MSQGTITVGMGPVRRDEVVAVARAERVRAYLGRLSGPLIDRLDPPMVVGKLVAMPPKAGS